MKTVSVFYSCYYVLVIQLLTYLYNYMYNIIQISCIIFYETNVCKNAKNKEKYVILLIKLLNYRLLAARNSKSVVNTTNYVKDFGNTMFVFKHTFLIRTQFIEDTYTKFVCLQTNRKIQHMNRQKRLHTLGSYLGIRTCEIQYISQI